MTYRNNLISLFAVGLLLLYSCNKKIEKTAPTQLNTLIPTSIPLITIDPYISCWSFSDHLNTQQTLHWTGSPYQMNGIIEVDDKRYRFLGQDKTQIIESPKSCTYTTNTPSSNWLESDNNWKKGLMPIGKKATFENVKTNVNTDSLWVKTMVELKDTSHLMLYVDCGNRNPNRMMIYINGIPELALSQYRNNLAFPLSLKARKSLKIGMNTIAIACLPRNKNNNNYVDLKFVREQNIPKAIQKSVEVLATQTHYTFTCGAIDLKLIFTSPLLMDNLKTLSTPISYVDFKTNATDGKSHKVKIYFDVNTEWCVNTSEQPIYVERLRMDDMHVLKAGSQEQAILKTAGDNVRIDWGYLYLTSPNKNVSSFIKADANITDPYIHKSSEMDHNKTYSFEKANTQTLALSFDLGSVSENAKNVYAMLAYDDLQSVEYFEKHLEAYWKNDGTSIEEAILNAAKTHDNLMIKCAAFDKALFNDALSVGGKEYAELCAIAYRQAISAHKLAVDEHGTPLFFSKENFSNGSMATVDVTYPSAPLFLVYNTTLLKGMLEPIFFYSESGLWTKDIAAHDIGKYPIGNGQKYKEDMPIEECGNMLILTAAICERDQDYSYAKQHWKTLSTWATYLKEKGFDPENQLCTDDFAGHLAHNANLSVKAIVALGCYAKMAMQLEQTELSKNYIEIAQNMVQQWIEAAKDGKHYSLTFDKKDSWSQKYNLVWDELLDLNLFPCEIIQQELAYYLTKQNEFGLPLDSRSDYTKTDWIIWTASMASSKEDFQRFIKPIHYSIQQSYDRQPLSDWYNTKNGLVTGFRARSVVGGFYIQLLKEKYAKN